ncbi:MAG TPA: tripartite tricarboxylate transporter substrate binding protein [Xanthobacteraceae bacterium]|nr:tripartite tricarboxylate transporter substrate binding protein [Xanthobacteraceae bacterium]
MRRGPAERMRRLIGIAFGCVLAAFGTPASAQPYPTHPIRLFVSFPPGGAADLVARVFGQALSVRLGQPVVIENRPGANGNLAGDAVAKADPDGYTLLLGPSALFGINPHLYAKMPIDPLKDLLPVASLVQNALVLAANPALTAGKDFRGFVALARAARPPLFYASIGNGSEHHLAMELLKQQAGIDLTHVPYRGGGPAAIGVIGGDVAAMFGGGSVAPLILSGQLRGLAVSAARRTPLLPDLPAIAEIYPGFEITLWQGLFAPVGTPPDIVARLRAEASIVRVLPEVTERLAAAGAGEPLVTTDAEFLARIRADYEKFGKVIRGIGAKVE